MRIRRRMLLDSSKWEWIESEVFTNATLLLNTTKRFIKSFTFYGNSVQQEQLPSPTIILSSSTAGPPGSNESVLIVDDSLSDTLTYNELTGRKISIESETSALIYDVSSNTATGSIGGAAIFITPALTTSITAGTPVIFRDLDMPILSAVNPKAEVAPLTRVDLDTDLELRGMLKLDANNNLYYDGDEYESDGTVARPYNLELAENIPWNSSTDITTVTLACNSLAAPVSSNDDLGNAMMEGYTLVSRNALFDADKTCCVNIGGTFIIHDESFVNKTKDERIAIITGKSVLYKLPTPTTESADPYITPVAVNRLGTEEFVDTRDVPIPVGHETVYTDGETTVTDKVPYLFRRVPAGNKKTEKIVGGTVAWNQLIQNGNFESASGWAANRGSIAVANNKCTFTSNAEPAASSGLYKTIPFSPHKYIVSFYVNASRDTTITVYFGGRSYTIKNVTAGVRTFCSIVGNSPASDNIFAIYVNSTRTLQEGDTVEIEFVNLFDLTQKFNSTIADYIYSLESTTEGAGVAWFKELFPKDYYPYNAGQLMSVKTSANVMTGVNQFDVSTALKNRGLAWSTGTLIVDNKSVVSDYIRVTNATYFTNYKAGCFGYDANKNYIGALRDGAWVTTTTGRIVNSHDVSGVAYVRFWFRSSLNDDIDLTTVGDICLNFSDPSINGKYVPYKISKTIAATYTLRGIGEAKDTLTVRSDGTGELTRNIGEIDMGTIDWNAVSFQGLNNQGFKSQSIENIKSPSVNIMCDKYVCADVTGTSNVIAKYGADANKLVFRPQAGVQICVLDSAYTDADTFKASLSGVICAFELDEPVVTQLTHEEVVIILNGACTFNPTTTIQASNDNSIDQEFSLTYAKAIDSTVNDTQTESEQNEDSEE